MGFGKRGLDARVASIAASQTDKAPAPAEDETTWTEMLIGFLIVGAIWLGVQGSANNFEVFERFRGIHDITKRVKSLDVTYVGSDPLYTKNTLFSAYHEADGYEVTSITLEVTGNSITRKFDCYTLYPLYPRNRGEFSCSLYLDGIGSRFNYNVLEITGKHS